MEQPKVYITKYQDDWDFGPATDFGEVVFLTEMEMKPEPVIGSYNDRITDEMKRGLREYECGTDYVVMTASATNNFKVANILHDKGVRHNILRWNNKHRKYDLYKI